MEISSPFLAINDVSSTIQNKNVSEKRKKKVVSACTTRDVNKLILSEYWLFEIGLFVLILSSSSSSI
jgi:hypothetical protein